jgi:hypothetical protein
MVGEVLAELLHQALKFYPDNDSWLKVLGDINFGKSLSRNHTLITISKIYCSQRILSQCFEELPRGLHCCERVFQSPCSSF